jgi:hypothetical protein
MLQTPHKQSLSRRTSIIKKNRKPLETAAKLCASTYRLDLIIMEERERGALPRRRQYVSETTTNLGSVIPKLLFCLSTDDDQ